jgi:hypothetical protein
MIYRYTRYIDIRIQEYMDFVPYFSAIPFETSAPLGIPLVYMYYCEHNNIYIYTSQ